MEEHPLNYRFDNSEAIKQTDRVSKTMNKISKWSFRGFGVMLAALETKFCVDLWVHQVNNEIGKAWTESAPAIGISALLGMAATRLAGMASNKYERYKRYSKDSED